MTSRHALLPAVTAAVVLVLALVLPFAGCGLPLQGLTSQPDAGSPCNADGQCDDMNACTADSCVEGTCNHLVQPDGPAPSSAQTAFDCKVLQCTGGKPSTEDDPMDIQADAEDCTIDKCDNGMPFHTAKPDSTACVMGGDGLCMGGVCVIHCTDDGMCDDKNPCTQDSCDKAQSLCSFAPLNGVNTPGAAQTEMDCKVQVCVDGVDTGSPDDSDLPKTATDCDQELCNNGVPSNPPLAIDVTCGTNSDKVCNGAGACVECNSPTQCGVDTDCLKYACNAGVCASVPVAVDTHIPMQTPGDCHAVVCDGVGGVKPQPIVDDTDIASDNNDCTNDTCANGVVGHPALPPGSDCGVGQKCNAQTLCGCSLDNQCGGAPLTCGGGNPGVPFTCGCTKTSCGQLGATCGTLSDACSSTLNCNTGAKDGTETDVDCGGGGKCATLCGQGKVCSIDADCGSGHCADGVCCDTACSGSCVACTAAKKGSGSDGVCGSIPAYQPDNAPVNTCVSPKACDGANQCKKTDGQACGGGNECVSGSCVDGVCCNTACGALCQACSAAKKGGGLDGVCGTTGANQTDTTGPQLCSGTNSCDGTVGGCKKNVGQACAGNSQCVNNQCVDGVCCGSASCGACQSCNLATPGTCTNVASGGTDNNPVATCTGSNVCDGTGVCKKTNGNGQTCTLDVQCILGNCVDGYCCNSACAGTCSACNVAASLGVCTSVPAGQPDNNPVNACAGGSLCDGAGACKKPNGQACTMAIQCTSGNCLDNVCCGSATCPLCQSCALNGNGTCSNIANNQPDNVPVNACSTTAACDGNGSCKKLNGQTCAAPAECASNQCVDLVCCGSSSCPTCQSCALNGNGTCSNIPDNMPDTVPVGACATSCNGSGVCRTATGLACPAGGAPDCQSTFCADGVCCNVACDAMSVCMACDGAVPGTCSMVKSASDNDSCPSATSTCDAAGACLLKAGQTCTVGTECASGNCNGSNKCT
jgi:hypothetical protein